VLSALGFLYSDVKNEFAQTFIRSLDDAQPGQVNEILARLGSEAKIWLREEGIGEQDQDLHYEVDVRYFRQGYEFSLDVDPDRLLNGGMTDIAARFGTAHERLYGFKLDHPVELVNLRAVGTGRVVKVKFPRFEKGGGDPSRAVVEQHRVYFDGNFVTANIYERDRLTAGNRIPGPAVIVQKDSTTVIHPGHVGEVDEYLNILIRPEGARA
jgi:N-methylhydantoinase A